MRRLALPILLAATVAATAAAPASARHITPLPATWQKGMNLAAFRWNDFSGDRFFYWVKRLRLHDHADSAMFVSRWIQYWKDNLRSDDLAATDINPAYGSVASCRHHLRTDYTSCQTPTLGAEANAIRYAQHLGMKVAIKPLVDVGRNAAAAADRSKIDIRDAVQRAKWFASYEYMLAQYARMARDLHVDTLVIGTGLTGMTNDPEDQAQWRQIIKDIRSGDLMGDGKGGFTGTLTYAATRESIYKDAYDPGAHQFFWDALDEIGVEGFWPLISGSDPDHDDPSVARLRQGWTYNFLRGGMPPGAALRALHDEYAKPVILTGLGYLSRGGTSADPSKGDYAQKAVGGKVNTEAQARPYEAAFDFWNGVARQGGWFRGIYWWNWLPKIASHSNGDYTAQGKPAETELCLRYLGHGSRACAPSPMPR
jgi:hypothetical protein